MLGDGSTNGVGANSPVDGGGSGAASDGDAGGV
jgi:hypothetical protein